jgi:hypothetical protein
MSTPGQQPTASQLYAAYEIRQEEADAAREISTDPATDAGMNYYLLCDEAETAYAGYQAAVARENDAQAEAAEREPEAGHG